MLFSVLAVLVLGCAFSFPSRSSCCSLIICVLVLLDLLAGLAVPAAFRVGVIDSPALKRHDHLLRKLLRKFHGYEVKTEGDAFMVAFFTPLDAILWCIAVQKALLESKWPEELLAQTAAR